MKDAKNKHPYKPTPDDIKRLLDYVREQDREMEIPILLAVVGQIRPNEICALRYDDIDGRVVHISKEIIRNEKNKWIEKEPKYRSANRYITLPEYVIKLIGSGNGRIVDMSPDALVRKFENTLASAGLNKFQFSMLHYYHLWVLKILDMPDAQIIEGGIFLSSSVLESIHREG